MNPASQSPHDDAIRETAAGWIVRRDRGLSAGEAVEFELWLAASPLHAAALQRANRTWVRLDRMPESAAAPVLAAATRGRAFWRTAIVGASLATAAVLAIVLLPARRSPSGPAADASVADAADAPRQVTLADGSVVELNRGSKIAEHFTAAERRVTLERGEAHFSVTKNPARPFIVRAGTVDIRAVGTAFDVDLRSAAVEVLVTEGVVKLNAAPESSRGAVAPDSIPLLNPGQRAVLALAPLSPQSAVVVTTVNQAEIARTLAWQEPLLRLTGATLAEVAANFEHRTGRRVILADPTLAGLRLGGRFRSDDVDGFAHVLATTLEIDVERTPDGTLVLRKKNQLRDSGK
jgi:transmembrane sensor